MIKMAMASITLILEAQVGIERIVLRVGLLLVTRGV
jgi:hypothetical protein